MSDKIREIKEHIKTVYKTYARPMVIGFSGGKDSSMIVQVIWQAIEELPVEDRVNEIFIITVDTLVETPYIISHINSTIDNLNKAAQKKNLPIKALKLHPEIENTFWVNILGKGYPAPTQMFRWCTERMKIAPVNKFIQENVSKYGEATIVLGARSAESSSRSQVLEKKKRDNLGLSLHQTLPAAYVYTPIENLSNDEVWEYLLKDPHNPWGMSNRDLSAMYKNASGGECPMVVDTSTPSCGKSRFGCWVCTLVKNDSSMENVIDSGEEWMMHLLEFRNILHETSIPEKKHLYRNMKGRNGRARFIKNTDKIAYGPYKFEIRKKFLKKLLEIQLIVQEESENSDYSLINIDELKEIRRIWKEEEFDWEDSVLKIYKEVHGKDLNFAKEDGIVFTKKDFDELDTICQEEDIDVNLIARLIDVERKLQGMSKRSGIMHKMDSILKEEWRTKVEVVEERNLGLNR